MAAVDISPVVDIDDDTEIDVPYHVFLWNDPVTPMQVVTRVLQKIFGYDLDTADLLMITAHLQGKAVVWTGEYEKAKSYCVQLLGSGLQSTIGRDS